MSREVTLNLDEFQRDDLAGMPPDLSMKMASYGLLMPSCEMADRQTYRHSLGRPKSRLSLQWSDMPAGLERPEASRSRAWIRWPHIDPKTAIWLEWWDVLVCLVTLLVAILAPYETAFLRRQGEDALAPRARVSFVVDLMIYGIFLADTCLQFFVAFPDPERPGIIIKEFQPIAIRYLKSWFAADMLAVLPLAYDSYILFSHPGSEWRDLVEVVGVCRLARLPRLADRLGFLRRFQIYFGFSFAVLELVKYFFLVTCCCHWMACVWGGVAFQLPAEHTWLTRLQSDKGGPQEQYEVAHNVYGISLYWAIMTLTSVGYGDIVPQSIREYWAASLCMAIAASLWTFIIGEVCRIAASIDPHEASFRQTMDDLNYLMRTRQMPQDMRESIRRYFYEVRELTRQLAQTSIIDKMSPMLQGQMAMHLHKPWMDKVWYLRQLGESEKRVGVAIARRLLTMFFAPSEEPMQARALYILRRGTLVRRGKILVNGDVWGEDMVLSNEHLREQAPARAISYIELLMLRYVDMIEAIENFPEVKAQIRKVQVTIATMRAVLMVSRVLKDLGLGLRSHSANGRIELTQEELLDVVVIVLRDGANAFNKRLTSEDVRRVLLRKRLNRRTGAPEDVRPTQASPKHGAAGSIYPVPGRWSVSVENCRASVFSANGEAVTSGQAWPAHSSNYGGPCPCCCAAVQRDSEEICKISEAVAGLTLKVESLLLQRRPSNTHRVY